MTDDRWLELGPAIEILKHRLNLPTGAAVRKMIEACASSMVGARELNPEPGNEWWPFTIPAVHWKDPDAHVDLETGAVALAGVTYGERILFADGHASMARIEIREDDLNHWLDRQPKSRKRRADARFGRPPAADWTGIVKREFFKRLDELGPPSLDDDDPKWRTQADAERFVTEICEGRGCTVQKTAVRENTKRLITVWKKSKAEKS
jgi:hypothetical protein